MHKGRLAALAALCFCVLAQAQEVGSSMTPMEAIEKAAEIAPRSVRGTFEMTVRETGAFKWGKTYLNSEDDYRDQRCLTIVIPRALLAPLTEKYGAAPAEYFKGKRIRVDGFAKRERIDFTRRGKPTGGYYYQTHVQLQSVEDLVVLDETAAKGS